MKTARSGCSWIVGLILLCGAAFMAFGWPSYIDRHGTPAIAVIKEKRENIRVWYSEWYRRFEIVAAYAIPGRPFHETICDVDEKTYDSLHPGNSVEAHYIPALMEQPFVAADHLTPCTLAGSVSLSNSLSRRTFLGFAVVAALAFLWLGLHIRPAAWVLAVVLCVALPYAIVPRLEPVPQQPVPATAKVDWVTEVNRIQFGHTRRSDLQLVQPYEIVRLRYLPPGKDTPVTAVDKVDRGSIPGLQRGMTVPIVYDARDPRVVQIQEGTREFARKAGVEMLEMGAVMVLLVVISAALGKFFGRPRNRAARVR